VKCRFVWELKKKKKSQFQLQAMQLFNILDVNKDGRIEYEEFMALAHPSGLQIL
jgi:Ca2+-binding EF-hand superfamily protein